MLYVAHKVIFLLITLYEYAYRWTLQKHIEEMKQTLQQMEEYEERAIDAEKTLEEVKMELLAVRWQDVLL